MNEVDRTGMKPKLGQSFMILPVTFDYSGGRKDSQKTANLWAVILSIVGVIFGVGITFNKNGNIFLNLVFATITVYVFAFIVRFFLLKEGNLRKTEIMLKDSDFKRDYKDFWGIYTVEEHYPYYCRFRNGKTGIFVQLNKDAVVGKYEESEFNHYEAISDAYNICGSSNTTMCHLDYMDFVGSDERLDTSFSMLTNVRNPDMKDILTDIYTYQQEQMQQRVTTSDIYVFQWTGNDLTAFNTIKRILACFMQANFRSYRILGSSDLRELSKTVMNLEDFSILDAMMNSFNIANARGIIPIKVVHSDGSEEVLGMTVEEKKQKQELLQKESELKKEELKRRKKNKNKQELSEDEEIDLFN